jgi:hypothetical protein
MCENICNIQINTLATYVEKNETLRTEACNIHHCNICNIPIYFCNIHLKHVQHTSETLEMYVCNMRFSPFFRVTQSRAGNDWV